MFQAPRAGIELPIEWGEDIEPKLDGLWLIKNTLPAQGLALLYGHPGSGKSFLAVDLGMHVALGWDWNGHRTRKGTVVYLAAEGPTGLRQRVAAFRRFHQIAGPLPFALIGWPIDLHQAEVDRPALVRAVRRAADRYGLAPGLVVIDTISKTLGSGRENTDDLATYVSNCNGLGSELDCCVLLLHHRPKDALSTQPRGHSSLKGGVDTVILVEAGRPRRASITKQRDGEERELLRFSLLPTVLGRDSDQEDVRSCVIVRAPLGPSEGAVGDAGLCRKLSDQQRKVLSELRVMLESDGMTAPPEVANSAIGSPPSAIVLIPEFTDRAIAALQTGSDSKPDSSRRTVSRALDRLQRLGIVGLWKDCLWIKP